MKKIGLLLAFAAALVVGCQKLSERENFELKLKDAIANHEKCDTVEVDSVRILSIDTLTRSQYAGLILEQLENMEFECELAYEAAGENVSAPEVKELELTIEEIRGACDFYREQFEAGDVKEDTFSIFFIDAEIYSKGEVSNYFYLITPDFVIHDDPFGDNLLE